MSLKYPEGFPDAFLAPVVAVNKRAEGVLRDAVSASNSDRRSRRNAAVEYIATVASVFGIQACKAAQAHQYPISRVEQLVETTFLRYLTVHVYYGFGLKKDHAEYERLMDEIEPLVKQLDRWREYEDALVIAAEKLDQHLASKSSVTLPDVPEGPGHKPDALPVANQANAASEDSAPGDGGAPDADRTLQWADLEITFISDERVQIRNLRSKGADGFQTKNYAELGLDDRRSGKPNLAWHTLKALADGEGFLTRPPGNPGNSDLTRAEKRIEEVRAALRNEFKIFDQDPLRFDPSRGGWVTGFRVRVSTAAET